MGFLVASVFKDLARWLQDRTALIMWIGIPFVVGGLITSMIDGGGGTPTGTLLVADEDSSFISGVMIGAYGQEQLGDLIIVEQVSIEEGEQRINDGEASGFLIIPSGFQQAFLEEEPVALTLKTNPSQTILPGIIRDVTEILLDAGFYAQRLFGPEIRTIMDAVDGDAPDDAFISEISVQISHKMTRLTERLDPLPIEVQIVEPPPSEPRPDLALLFLPGIVLMAVLLTANTLSGDFWVERDKQTLRRLVSAPNALWGFVGGKALAALFIMMGVTLPVLVAGFFYHEMAWSKMLSSLLWVSVGGLGLFAWFAAIQMMLPNQKAASIVTMILVFPLMMIGGSFFPLAALPDWIGNIGRMAPNGFVVDRLSGELTSVTAWSMSAANWLVLAAIAGSGLLICGWRLRAGFARG